MKVTKVYCDSCKAEIQDTNPPQLAFFIKAFLDGSGHTDSEFEYYDMCQKCAVRLANKVLDRVRPYKNVGTLDSVSIDIRAIYDDELGRLRKLRSSKGVKI